jgi:hypothetical protein
MKLLKPLAVGIVGITVSLLWTPNQVTANNSVHITYHWHLHQPLYWPAPASGGNRVQFAAESYDIKTHGGGFYPGSQVPHPQNNLAQGDVGSYDPVFSNADRVQAYQWGGKNSISTMSDFPDAGASITYSGSLMDNIWSWGKDNRLGYSPDWNKGYSDARRMKTSSGAPKADLVGFTYHHSLGPLLPKSVFKKELQIFKEAWWKAWGGNPDKSDHSKGYFPTEAAFSETLIPTLVEEGYEWSIIPGNHLARTCRNYLAPDVAPNHSNSTWNTNPPNLSDMTGPSVPANQWWSGTTDGRGAKLPAPFAYQAHKAKYVNPETGKETKITVVPMDDVQSYINGFGTMGTNLIDAHVTPFNDPNHPSIVLLAHDGDNAWGGGFSYYFESVPGLAREAASKGYSMTTIQEFLNRHPVPENDVVHVENGGWVNPDGDWGDPQFVKWLYPPARSPNDPNYNWKDPRSFIDIENGFSTAWRSWAVIIAGANVCETAEQIVGPANVKAWKIQEPVRKADGGSNNPNDAEMAWHYYLAGLDSGFMYYGESLDDEVKQSLALNNAMPYAKRAIGNGAGDFTPPSVFRPQRFPHNPGGVGWGVTTHYQDVGTNGRPAYSSDFYIWTLAYDVSGVQSVTLKVRQSMTGTNDVNNNDNKTYAGGPSVGPWTSIPMNRRVIDPQYKGNPPNPNIDFFVLPEAIADHYWAKVTGYKNVMLDYYIEALDTKGNLAKTDIDHVWVGAGQ